MATKIYIDQGHNPRNPNAGAEGNGLREQDLTYRIGIELAALINVNPNLTARLSRPNENTQLGTSNATSLRARVDDANTWGADYFISLHTNASSIESASGSEGFVYALNTTADRLSTAIIKNLTEATGLRNRGIFARPGLYVLRKTVMPATLIELGFITNPSDAALMNENPALFARGVYNGIIEFLRTTQASL